MPLDKHQREWIEHPLHQLASANSDSLRSAQRLFAQLIAGESQEASIDYAIELFTQLNAPQRIQVLREVQLHLAQDRYPCLAFENNARFFDHVLTRLEDEIARTEEVSNTGVLSWISKLRAETQEKHAHGSPAHIAEVTTLTSAIRDAAQTVSVEPRELHVSDSMHALLVGLTDNQLARIISFVTDIRNIRACRDRFNEVADEKYIAEKLGIKEDDLAALGFPSFMKDFHAYLRNHLDVVQEIAGMDFVELSLLIDHISNFRSQKYRQGRTSE